MLPPSTPVGADGAVVTNPDGDGSRVSIPPGTFEVGEMANISVVAVSLEHVKEIADFYGVSLPDGFELSGAAQVGIQVGDPVPQLALNVSIPMPTGIEAGDTLIHTIIEPAHVEGGSTANTQGILLFDGGVTIEDGRVVMQISTQNFPAVAASPKTDNRHLPQIFGTSIGIAGQSGRSCAVRVPPGIPTCFISGTVRDSNGSPVSGAMVSISPDITLVSRTNAFGFYRAIVREGLSTVTAKADIGMSSTTVECETEIGTRIAGVDITIDVAVNPDVPIVTITDPATDVTVNQSFYEIQGDVSPTTISEAVVTTQTGDFADSFIQAIPVTAGIFTTRVPLTAGRENTVTVLATDNNTNGSDSRVITVMGSEAEDIRFTATWDEDQTDINLLVRTPGPNGIADSVDGLTIGGFHVDQGDGGMLDVDDTNGFGPENITFPAGAAQPGEYAFMVHYCEGAIPLNVTVSAFVGGKQVATFSAALNNSDDSFECGFVSDLMAGTFFNIGTLRFPSGTIGPPITISGFEDEF